MNPKYPRLLVFENVNDFLSAGRVIPADLSLSAVTNLTNKLRETVTSLIGKLELDTLIGVDDPPREHLTELGTVIVPVVLPTETLRAGKPV